MATPPVDRSLALRLRGVRHAFPGGVVALDGVDLDVPAGQFLAILGPSGCGKSTLLRLIAGLDVATGGSVQSHAGAARDDAAAPPALRDPRSEIAYVFQDAHLLPWRTVLSNVALPLELMRVRPTDRLAASRAALAQVGLVDFAGHHPAQLSGGMRMRVSLARALVTDPKLLLLDEPFAALDEITRHRLDEQLRGLWASRGMTVVFVTHSTTEAAFLAQRAIVLSRRPGRIVEDRAVALPADRDGPLRGTEAFAREARLLYEALERGEK